MNIIFQIVSLTPAPQSNFSPLAAFSAGDIISGLIRVALIVAVVVFLFLFVFGGIRWIFSGGDKQAVESARSQLTSALVGLLIVFATWAIILVIQRLFCINLTNLVIPSIQSEGTTGGGGCPTQGINPANRDMWWLSQ